jgi:hypothetical protein
MVVLMVFELRFEVVEGREFVALDRKCKVKFTLESSRVRDANARLEMPSTH